MDRPLANVNIFPDFLQVGVKFTVAKLGQDLVSERKQPKENE